MKVDQCRWMSGEAWNRNPGDHRDAQLVPALSSTEICETSAPFDDLARVFAVFDGLTVSGSNLERESIVAAGLYGSALRVGYASLVER